MLTGRGSGSLITASIFFPISRIVWSVLWRYVFVVWRSECPSKSWIYRRETPGVSFYPGKFLKPCPDKDIIRGDTGRLTGIFQVLYQREGGGGGFGFRVPVLGQLRGKVLETPAFPLVTEPDGEPAAWIEGYLEGLAI
jgi:hypothetical protein